MNGEIRRIYMKHKAEPHTYAVEIDDRAEILRALDVTDEATKGGLCQHMLDSLPLAGNLDDVQYLTRARDQFELYEPDCINTHHLMRDLLELERDYREATREWTLADNNAKALKKTMEAKGEKVHGLLVKVQDYGNPLPLFDQRTAA